MLEKYKNTIVWSAALVLVAGLAFVGGYWTRKPETITVTKVQTVEKIVKINAKVKDNTVTETVIKRPDGTVETTTTKNDVTTNTTVDEKTTATTQTVNTKTPTAAAQPNYSVGAAVRADVLDPFAPPTYDFSGGYRLLGNLWVEGMANFQLHQVGLGVRIAF